MRTHSQYFRLFPPCTQENAGSDARYVAYSRVAHIETTATNIVPLTGTILAAGQTTASLSPTSAPLPPVLSLSSTASDDVFLTATATPTASSTFTSAAAGPTERASSATPGTARSMIILIVVVVVIGTLIVAGLIGGLLVYLRKRRRRRVAPSTAYLRSAAAAESGGANMGAGPSWNYGAMATALGQGLAGEGGSSPVSVLSRPEWGTAGAAESPTTPVSTLHTLSPLRPNSLGRQGGASMCCCSNAVCTFH